jgi:anti-sigma-K factor RskA
MSPFDAPRHECDQALEAGAYLLKALPADERSAYAEHLQSCQECRHEVEQLRSVVDTLPIAAPQLAPPPELKDRIMRIVDSEAELLRASGPEADRVRTPQKAEGRTRRWASGLFLRPAVAGGLASILIAVGVAGGVLLSGGDSTPSTRNVTAQVAAAGATATVSVQDGRAALHVRNLPAAPFGKVYQVWIRRKGVPAPIPTHTLFNVRKSDGSAVVPIEESVKDVEQVMVTDEPDGGSTQPTGTQLISATLS